MKTKDDSELVKLAGCKKKKWLYDDKGNVESFEYVANGQLVQEGACIVGSYRKYIAPNQGQTKVHTIIEYQTVRNVDAKDQTLSFDLMLTLKWLDPGIRTRFSEEDNRNTGIILTPEKTVKIWKPDLFIWNRTSVTPTNRWVSQVHCKISMSSTINNLETKRSTVNRPLITTVEMKYAIKTTVYCKFQYSRSPMDTQNCSVNIGSSSFGAIFTLLDINSFVHTPKKYDSVGLKLAVTFFGSENKFGNETVGFHVQMNRLLQPFLLMYYIPCIAIVLVSELGFVVRLTSDGSVGLLVTQLLTLVNLFVYQMVSSFMTYI